jgi:Zn-dependent M28 family amino/carboxypeptidase
MMTSRFYSLAVAPALISLSACAVRTLPATTAAAAAPLFATAVADVARMERDTNEGRFDAVTAMLAERNIAFTVEPFTIAPRKGEPRTQGRNIVVTIAGRLPEIVVGAHYDAWRLPDGTLSKGAVDNAASAVILVRLADALMRAQPNTQMRIVFFDMEELGLLGSTQFVQAHRDRPMRAMVNLDINASGDAMIFGPHRATNDAVFQALRAACVAIARTCVAFPSMPASDDISFQKGGVPAISIATIPKLDSHQLWLLMNGGKESGLQMGFTPQILRTIHTAADTSSLVDRDTMAQTYRVALTLITALDAK